MMRTMASVRLDIEGTSHSEPDAFDPLWELRRKCYTRPHGPEGVVHDGQGSGVTGSLAGEGDEAAAVGAVTSGGRTWEG